jgi:hypothetical protein
MRFALLALSCALTLAFPLLAAAEDGSTNANQSSTVCTFEDSKQFSIRYPQVPLKEDAKLPNSPWTPKQSPIFLFTQTPLKIGSSEIPVGAYSVYLEPGKTDWDLIVNRDVKPDQKYDKNQDLGRADMQIGTLPNASKSFTMYLGHIAPKTCTLRVDYGKTRAFVDIAEK